jgi:hypothetical protein
MTEKTNKKDCILYTVTQNMTDYSLMTLYDALRKVNKLDTPHESLPCKKRHDVSCAQMRHGQQVGEGGEMSELDAASRVVAIRLDGLKSWRELRGAADGVAYEIRRLQGQGYALRGATINAWLMRDDEPLEVSEELRPQPGGRLGSKRRTK